jgi:hypothetical protein
VHDVLISTRLDRIPVLVHPTVTLPSSAMTTHDNPTANLTITVAGGVHTTDTTEVSAPALTFVSYTFW